ncbi:MAG: lyase family protein [Candidatus Zipacnadales bacterium]
MLLDTFDCVSPLDFRYYATNEKLSALLAPYVTERGRLQAELAVEVAVVRVLARRGLCSPTIASEIEAAAARVKLEDVVAEDARIHHSTRALVNCLRAQVSEAAKPFVHLMLTSFDVKDTATAWRFKQATEHAIVPTLLDLEQTLIELALREKDTLQMGRTHGQHAVPITFGFALASYVSRLGGRIETIRRTGTALPGKISGAVGAHNAQCLFLNDPLDFEREVLAEMGLEPSVSSTQIVEPEPMADFMHALVSTLGVLGNLADDMRHLQRTEIAEVAEEFAPDQVGSSTMPHKRNPWNFENIKSFWKAFMPRMITVYMDQISEHQRDLSNSASARFLPEIIVGLVATAQRANRLMSRLVTDRGQMRRVVELSQGMSAAEPAYILLAAHGHPDAHEAIRKITLEAEVTRRPFVDIFWASPELQSYISQFTEKQCELLRNVDAYRGIAADKTEHICSFWKERLGLA